MPNVAVALGYNNANLLEPVNPQPAQPDPIRFAEVNYGGDGSSEFNGFRTARLVWRNGVKRTGRNSILGQFGLSDTVASAQVTVRLRKNFNLFGTFNAIARHEQPGRRNATGWEAVEIELIKLVEIV